MNLSYPHDDDSTYPDNLTVAEILHIYGRRGREPVERKPNTWFLSQDQLCCKSSLNYLSSLSAHSTPLKSKSGKFIPENCTSAAQNFAFVM